MLGELTFGKNDAQKEQSGCENNNACKKTWGNIDYVRIFLSSGVYYNSIHELIQDVKVIKNTCALSLVFYSALCGVLEMDFTYEYVNNVPVISFIRDDGSLLDSAVNDFGEEILKIIKDDVYKIVFDLRNNSYLNSFGLGELINLRNYFLDKGIATVLIVTSTKIIKLFDMVGIGELFETIASENEI